MARLPVFIILFESRTARLDTSGYIAHTAAAATAMPAAKPAAKATVFMPLISFRTFYLAFVIWTEIFKGKSGEEDGGLRLRFFYGQPQKAPPHAGELAIRRKADCLRGNSKIAWHL